MERQEHEKSGYVFDRPLYIYIYRVLKTFSNDVNKFCNFLSFSFPFNPYNVAVSNVAVYNASDVFATDAP